MITTAGRAWESLIVLVPHAPGPAINTGGVGDLALYLLAGGGALGLFTLVKAYLAVRDNVDTREATGIGNLEKWRHEADERADRAHARAVAAEEETAVERRWGAYWERRAVNAEHALVVAGVPVPDPPTEPPPRS